MSKKRWSVVAFVTLVLMAVTANLWLLNKPIKVSFVSEAEENLEYQVFYSDKKNGSFDEKQSVKKSVKKGKQSVTIELPVERIYIFKLAIAPIAQKVIISNLEINGWKRLEITEDSPLMLNDGAENINVHQKVLTLLPTKEKVEITYTKRLKLKSGKTPDICLFIIFFTLSLLLAYKIVEYASKFQTEEGHQSIDIVFLGCFFTILFIPMSNISKEEVSHYENRVLAQPPLVFSDGKINTKLGEQFEKWFNDRFYGRRLFIKIDEDIKSSFVLGNEKVLVGKEDWLFYKGGNSLNNYANKTEFSQTQLAKGLKYLTDIDNWCKQRNKKFYYVLIPDKNKIYGEYITQIKKVKPDSEGSGWQFVNYIKENSNINVIYLSDLLIKSKGQDLLYWKNDTHWNRYGAYIGYQGIMEAISKDFAIDAINISEWNEQTNEQGDLSEMYETVKKRYKTTKYKEPVLEENAKCTKTDKPVGWEVECNNEKGKLRVFTLRDSFSNMLQKYYAETFKQTKMSWKYGIDKSDLDNIEKNYDIVILENVERFLSQILDLSFPEE